MEECLPKHAKPNMYECMCSFASYLSSQAQRNYNRNSVFFLYDYVFIDTRAMN